MHRASDESKCSESAGEIRSRGWREPIGYSGDPFGYQRKARWALVVDSGMEARVPILLEILVSIFGVGVWAGLARACNISGHNNTLRRERIPETKRDPREYLKKGDRHEKRISAIALFVAARFVTAGSALAQDHRVTGNRSVQLHRRWPHRCPPELTPLATMPIRRGILTIADRREERCR